MRDLLRHRGPDDAGSFVDEGTGVALGVRRLAVIDLSPAGHQPMVSSDGRFVLAYNGEIYNHLELRSELEKCGHRFRGSSDTEVLLSAVQAWGLERALKRCEGMFAFAMWDRRDRALHLARDRFGEKPLYYGWGGRVLLFGSELKALRAHPCFDAPIDRGSLALYFRHNCVPAPYSIYRDIWKLPPGTSVTFTERTKPGDVPPVSEYWTLRELVERATSERSAGAHGAPTLHEQLDELEAVLGNAVRSRMRSDVPLGAFLSGGVDSSLLVALMQKQSLSKVRTFTISFEDPAFDEGPEAARVAAHLGTEHLNLQVNAGDALSVIPSLPDIYDEPFADSSQIPTVLLSRLTREHVTVALSGDGGDEVFGGYNRYVWASRFWRRIDRVPRPLRRVAGAALNSVPMDWWERGLDRAGALAPSRLRVRLPGLKFQKAARVLPARDLGETHLLLASHFEEPAKLVPGSVEHETVFTSRERWPAIEDPIELMMFIDSVSYLPDDILTKVDRATMSAALEGRLPYLDLALWNFAWRRQIDTRVRAGEGKWLLRHLLYRHVHRDLVERPKAGFGIPLGSWLRGPLRDWAEDLIGESRLAAEGYLSPSAVRRLWREHLSGRHAREYELWDVLMFQAWLARTQAS